MNMKTAKHSTEASEEIRQQGYTSFPCSMYFADSEKEDIRHQYDAHSLKILSMEENGNVTFAVYGYMNRGKHEGESGAAIYYFKLAQNVVEEKVFIPSTKSYEFLDEDLGMLSYVNENQQLFLLLAEKLCLLQKMQ